MTRIEERAAKKVLTAELAAAYDAHKLVKKAAEVAAEDVYDDGWATYDAAVSFGPIDLAPGRATLSTSVNGDSVCDTAAWLDLELTPR